MKISKKITAMLLAIALTFSSTYIATGTKVSAATANDWKSAAITYPAQDSLVGAGYIDIKWSNNLDNVASYKVYVDGEEKGSKSPSGSTMSCEFYSTQVSSHTAYIVATLNDGSRVQTDTRTFFVTKKGVCVNQEMGNAVDAKALNVGWYYNWGYKSFSDEKFKNKTFYNIDYVPMIWGNGVIKSAAFENAQKQGYKYMLGYNEPDLSWEAGMSTDAVMQRWPEFVNSGLRLGSPAVSTFPTWSKNWWQPFWKSFSQKSSFSFIAIHSYQGNLDGAKSALQYLQAIDECYETYGKPMWITEFAVAGTKQFSPNDPKVCADVQNFMKIVLKGLNERSYVERFSWFCFNPEKVSAGASGIFNYESGQLTNLGKIYAQIGNPSGYNATSYGVQSSTSYNTSPAACAAALPTTLYSTTGKKKSFKFKIKSVSKAAGYQIQYGKKKSMKGAKKKFVKKTSGTIKKLKKKTKYYVRVRAYKVLYGKKLYCGWSKKQKVKTKK